MKSHARWAVVRNNVIKIADVSAKETVMFKDSFTFYEVNKSHFKDLIDVSMTSSENKDIVSVCDPKAYYGLDVFTLADGRKYAVGTANQSWDAAYLKTEESIWKVDVSNLSKFLDLSSKDIQIIQDMVDFHHSASNNIVKLMLGKNLFEYVSFLIGKNSLGDILGNYDSMEYVSDNISGLPCGFFAYRVDSF